MNVLSSSSAARGHVRLFVLIYAVLVMGVLPTFAQDTTYTDPAGHFTTTIPNGWTDQSTAEYGLFTSSGVSLYLLSVDEGDVQVAIDAAIAIATPQLATTTATPAGEFPTPSGTWSQFIYIASDAAGTAVAQSNGSVTVVLIAVGDSISTVQALLGELNGVIASINFEGGGTITNEAEVDTTDSAPMPTTQVEITFPELTGAYDVGRAVYLWTDDSREEAYTPDEGDSRVVSVWVWYPAAPTPDSEIAPYLTEGMSTLFQQQFGLDTSGVHIHAYESAPVLPAPSGYPVVVFSHGNGMNSAFYASMLEEIASYGYVVVGIDHTYNALFTTEANGQVIPALPDALDQSDDDFATRIADVTFVLDQLPAVNNSDDLLMGSLDLDHIGFIGHSFGGATLAEVCRMDARCNSVIVIDVPLQGEVAVSGLSQPIMLLDTERIDGAAFAQETEAVTGQPVPDYIPGVIDDINTFRDTTAAMLLGMSPDAYRVIIDGTRHNSYSDIPLLATGDPTLLFFVGGIAGIDAERGQRVISDYVLAFFDTYLKGDANSLLDGTSPDYPEVTIAHGER